MSDNLKAFLDRVFNVAVGEAADNMFDQISQGLGVISAIYFLFHKISRAKIDALSNEDLVASLLAYPRSDNTTSRIIDELVAREHFFSWYMIYLSEKGFSDRRQTAFDEMTRLVRSADELAVVAKCSHPLLSQGIRDRSNEMLESFLKEFLKQ